MVIFGLKFFSAGNKYLPKNLSHARPKINHLLDDTAMGVLQAPSSSADLAYVQGLCFALGRSA